MPQPEYRWRTLTPEQRDEVLAWRWVAWLEGGAFAAAITWGDEIMKAVAPTPHGLEDAALLPIGWQLGETLQQWARLWRGAHDRQQLAGVAPATHVSGSRSAAR